MRTKRSDGRVASERISSVEKVMDGMLKKRAGLVAVVGLASALGGCMGSPSDAASSTLILTEAEPLESIAEEVWEEAPPDCEGLVRYSVSFRVASLTGGLVACLDARGEVVCVDTVEEVSEDLDASGRGEEADALSAGFVAAVQGEDMALAISTLTSDPEPQPNMRPRRFDDPEPQPN